MSRIRDKLLTLKAFKGEISAGVREDYRSVTSREFGAGFDWILDPILDICVQANDETFGFRLAGIAENLNYLIYASPGDHYDRHIDVHLPDLHTEKPNRKLTFIMQLSKPDDYVGCDVSIDGDADEGEPLPRGLGDLIIFPAWTAHKVTPLESGARHSIVGWVHGPAWC